MASQVIRSELSNLKMVSGNEAKYSVVIDGGVRKEWVGIGWIEAGPAIPADFDVYPVVVDKEG